MLVIPQIQQPVKQQMRESNVLAPFLRHSSTLDGLGLTPEGCKDNSPLPFQENILTPCDPNVATKPLEQRLSSVKKRLFSDGKEPEAESNPYCSKIYIDE
jgi:hypothetical protein